MSPQSRRALLSAFPAAAAALAGCAGRFDSNDDDDLPVETRWQRTYDSPTPPTPAPDGTLLFGSRSPFSDGPLLAAVDPETGDERWQVQGPDAEGSPVGADERLAYALSKRERLVAVRHDTGEVAWRTPIDDVDAADPGVVDFAPIPIDDTLLVPISGTEDDVPDRVVGVNRDDGAVRFSHEFPASLAGAPAPAYSGVIVPLLDGTLRAVGVDGTERWRHTIGAAMSPPVVADETVYVGCATESIRAVDLPTGDLVWESPLENTVFSRPLVADETVYVGGADYYLTAVDRASGERRWRSELPNAVTSGPTLAEGRLVTLAGGEHRIRGPSGTLPFDPTTLAVHDRDGTEVRTVGFDGYPDGGEIRWAAAVDGDVYLGQERRLSRLAPEVLADD